MADPRVSNVGAFVPTSHASVPASLAPRTVHLPSNFTACIIGAGVGIGSHIALAFAHAGATRLIIAARTLSDLHAVRDEIHASINANLQIDTQLCDMSSATSVAALASHIQSQYGRLDVVVANAAYAPPITGMKVTENEPSLIARAFDVNATGTYSVAHYFVPLLRESVAHGGMNMFVAIGSFAALLRRGPIANPGYAVSKMAQVRLVEYLAEQFGGSEEGKEAKPLLAVAVHPGGVMTDMAKGNTPDDYVKHLSDDVDLAGAWVVQLCKRREECQWMTGRLVSAKWDFDQFMSRKNEVLQKDLLKFELRTD
jgi:NAD(P)-dependent dehydrogenase (short-subunit alcohol dehydrogenase family)